ncbi:hypothetical protein, partial [Acinetobacter baumannii]|uniref:hypothetical protein n=1 Tax=Acinetobacter baumannii TaxID=470 RepID=UPI003F684E74
MLGGEFRGSGEDDAQCLAHAGLAKRKRLAGASLWGMGSRLLSMLLFQLLADAVALEGGQVVDEQ